VTLRTDRPPVRPRSGRRPLPPLIFLVVLAVAAAAVWWYVIRQEEQHVAQKQAACSTVSAAPPSLDPAAITLRVYNATDTAGLATTVANSLKQRGFTVGEVANDTSGRQVSGVGELRHGSLGKNNADYVRLFIPNIGDYPDTRADDTVDVVIGPDFKTLASADEVAKALAPAAAAAATC
jgi:LytR cell envelope-related transcriptional attenuator